QPTPVVRLNQIAAQAKLHGPEFALDAMESLSNDLSNYRWFHAMRGVLSQELGDHEAAIASFKAVLELELTEPECAAIREKILISQKELGHL
ncbi:MAG: RNA polymerase sigma factor, partial [Pseudomonadota bacterium]